MASNQRTRAGRIVAVGGGKGGVGKSVISTNLAYALAAQGRHVVLVDADLGAPNLHTLLGLSHPEGGLQAFLDHETEDLEAALMRAPTSGVRLLAGSARVGVANLSHKAKRRLLTAIARLPTDVVVIDLGAGTTLNTLDFFDLADLRVLVMTPQLTSLQNAYSFLKAAAHRSLTLAAEHPEDKELITATLAEVGETQRMGVVLDALRRRSAGLAHRCAAQLGNFGVLTVGNQVHEERETHIITNMSRMIRDYLLVPAPVTAMIRHSSEIRESVNARTPLLASGGGAAATQLRLLARALAAIDIARLRRDRAGVRGTSRFAGVAPTDEAVGVPDALAG